MKPFQIGIYFRIAPDMKWNFARPTQPGFYWFRDTKRGIYEQVVEIEAVPRMGFVAQKELWWGDERVTSIAASGEWAGPIESPS